MKAKLLYDKIMEHYKYLYGDKLITNPDIDLVYDVWNFSTQPDFESQPLRERCSRDVRHVRNLNEMDFFSHEDIYKDCDKVIVSDLDVSESSKGYSLKHGEYQYLTAHIKITGINLDAQKNNENQNQNDDNR